MSGSESVPFQRYDYMIFVIALHQKHGRFFKFTLRAWTSHKCDLQEDCESAIGWQSWESQEARDETEKDGDAKYLTEDKRLI